MYINLPLLKALRLAAVDEKARPYLNGVNIHPRNGYVHLSATNGSALIMALLTQTKAGVSSYKRNTNITINCRS